MNRDNITSDQNNSRSPVLFQSGDVNDWIANDNATGGKKSVGGSDEKKTGSLEREISADAVAEDNVIFVKKSRRDDENKSSSLLNLCALLL